MLKHVWKSYRTIQEFLKGFPVNHHPVEYQMAPILNEANTVLYSMLSTLQQSPLNKKQLKYYLSVIYQDVGALEPLLRSWVRASTWMDSADSDEIERRKELLHQLKDQLMLMVPYIEDVYGIEESIDIIPPIYRSSRGLMSS
jgi:hypothetical protein